MTNQCTGASVDGKDYEKEEVVGGGGEEAEEEEDISTLLERFGRDRTAGTSKWHKTTGNTLKYCRCCHAATKYDGFFCFVSHSSSTVLSLKKKGRWKIANRIETEMTNSLKLENMKDKKEKKGRKEKHEIRGYVNYEMPYYGYREKWKNHGRPSFVYQALPKFIACDEEEIEELSLDSQVKAAMTVATRGQQQQQKQTHRHHKKDKEEVEDEEERDKTYFFLVEDFHTVEESVENAIHYISGGHFYGAVVGQDFWGVGPCYKGHVEGDNLVGLITTNNTQRKGRWCCCKHIYFQPQKQGVPLAFPSASETSWWGIQKANAKTDKDYDKKTKKTKSKTKKKKNRLSKNELYY
eukprot:TRINITY_DN8140_c0_g1_i2.p1 TRINITY_DN8140_c0_g1~~TRINITY_DN8140_c0_g1_i2.p1  ORF type:complete len:351 (+),score=108.10 TRINITY_DN8140_c0_g1_i2:179-1231(+)